MKKSLWPDELQDKIDALDKQGKELVKHAKEIRERNMNTSTTSTQSTENITRSAAEIVDLIEHLGFVAEEPVVDLELQICYILQRNFQQLNGLRNLTEGRILRQELIPFGVKELKEMNKENNE